MHPASLQRILLAEDDPDVLEITAFTLSHLGGFALETCQTGSQVVEIAQRFHPDLILLDVMMPDMDGPAALAALRATASCAGIPVVFITAKIQPGEVKAYLSLGAAAVITKPFDPVALPGRLRAIFEETQQ